MRESLEAAMARIAQMERLYDEAAAALAQGVPPRALDEKRRALEAYMDSGQWLRDYQLDERGQLPRALKRGVLSEDGLYNLLADIREKGE